MRLRVDRFQYLLPAGALAVRGRCHQEVSLDWHVLLGHLRPVCDALLSLLLLLVKHGKLVMMVDRISKSRRIQGLMLVSVLRAIDIICVPYKSLVIVHQILYQLI